MKHFSLLIFMLLLANGQLVAADESMSDAQKIRFCERVRDHALQTYYNRERGQPIKLFSEDGSDGARITNVIVKRIYAEPQISTPKKAEDFGRAKCNEMMGTKLVPE
jgi:hypothetical protein